MFFADYCGRTAYDVSKYAKEEFYEIQTMARCLARGLRAPVYEIQDVQEIYEYNEKYGTFIEGSVTTNG